MLFKFTSRGVKCYGLLCFSSSAHENRSKLDIVVGYCCLSLLFFCVREAYETNNKRNQRDFAGSLLVVHWLFSLHSFSVLAFASQTKNKNSFSPFGSTICFLRITTRPGHMRGCCRVFFWSCEWSTDLPLVTYTPVAASPLMDFFCFTHANRRALPSMEVNILISFSRGLLSPRRFGARNKRKHPKTFLFAIRFFWRFSIRSWCSCPPIYCSTCLFWTDCTSSLGSSS